MTAPQRFARIVLEDPDRARRVAALIQQGHSIAFAIRITYIADKERRP